MPKRGRQEEFPETWPLKPIETILKLVLEVPLEALEVLLEALEVVLEVLEVSWPAAGNIDPGFVRRTSCFSSLSC